MQRVREVQGQGVAVFPPSLPFFLFPLFYEMTCLCIAGVFFFGFGSWSVGCIYPLLRETPAPTSFFLFCIYGQTGAYDLMIDRVGEYRAFLPLWMCI